MNIEHEVREKIIRCEANQAAAELNLLTDQFREGRDSAELLYLLNSDDDGLVSTGVYIANEVSFDRYSTSDFIDRLHHLTRHELPKIRFLALGALFPSLDKTDPASRDLICRLRKDDNEGVRIRAEAAANRLGIDKS